MRGVVRARAPLRLGLAGGGTDVSPYSDTYGGCVLNATIDRFALASVRLRDDRQVEFFSTDLNRIERLDLSEPFSTDEGLRLHRGVYRRLMEQFNGGEFIPLTMTTHVESPLGSGLGSSSALVVAMIEALREVVHAPLGEYEVARLAFDIERRELALQGGKQDQYAATFGGFNFIEFERDGHVIVNPLRVKSRIANELETSMVLFFTGASRDSAAIIEKQSTNVAIGGSALEAMHDLKTNAVLMKQALLLGDIHRLADLLELGWTAKKRTSPAVANAEIDAIYDVARANGAMAGKISGAGGGGFFMFIADPIRRPELVRRLAQIPNGSVEVCRFTSDGVATWRYG
jgi:D-glycero-alpha-D-manno-heptose-7-phosphate kinase